MLDSFLGEADLLDRPFSERLDLCDEGENIEERQGSKRKEWLCSLEQHLGEEHHREGKVGGQEAHKFAEGGPDGLETELTVLQPNREAVPSEDDSSMRALHASLQLTESGCLKSCY